MYAEWLLLIWSIYIYMHMYSRFSVSFIIVISLIPFPLSNCLYLFILVSVFQYAYLNSMWKCIKRFSFLQRYAVHLAWKTLLEIKHCSEFQPLTQVSWLTGTSSVGAASQWWSNERMMVYFELMMVKCSLMMVMSVYDHIHFTIIE